MLSGDKIHKNYIPELDGLRGIAILLVIAFHYFGSRFDVFSIGWSGVDLFFVLSGYLITSRLILTRENPDYFRRFYKNRILRIFPLYYGTLIGFYFIIPLFIPEYYYEDLAFYREHASSFFLFLENWTFIDHPEITQNHLQILWSLAVEEQFYLIWPFFIFLFLKNKNLSVILATWLLLTIILRSALYWLYPDNYYVFFYNTFCRMDAFIVGAGLYLLHSKILRSFPSVITLTSIFLLVAGIGLWGTNPARSLFIPTIGFTCIAIFWAYVIQIAIKKKYGWFTILLNRPWLIFVGRISYGLYIFHWVILRFSYQPVSNFIHKHFSAGKEVSAYLTLFLCLVVSFFLSILSFKYFESYFLKLKRKKVNRSILSA